MNEGHIAWAYDQIASQYAFSDAGRVRDERDWADLRSFVEMAAEGGPVLDLGCGPGVLSAWMAAQGLAVRGIDISPEMVRHARAVHPAIRFDVGDMRSPGPDAGGAGGILAWYSLIHVPTNELRSVLARWAELVRPGRPLLVAVQVGSEPRRVRQWFGEAVDLLAHRWPVDEFVEAIAAAGWDVERVRAREPTLDEQAPRVNVLATRSPGASAV